MTRRNILAACAPLVAACACANKREPSFDFGEPKARYSMRGEVLRLRPANRIAVIKHEKIDGWMDAMTMDFPVPDAQQFALLKDRMKIRATVLVNDSYFWLTDIQVEQ